MSNIDASLSPIASGEHAGKVSVAGLRTQLFTAKNEITAIQAQIAALAMQDAQIVDDIDALTTQANALGQQINNLSLAIDAKASAAQGALADSALQPDDIGVSVQAHDANTAKLNLPQTYTATAGRIATVGDGTGAIDITGTTITLDLTKAVFFDLGVLTAATGYTLATPIGITAFKSINGWIKVTQPVAGAAATLAYAAAWKTSGGVAPALSAVNNKTDFLDISSYSAAQVRLALSKDW